MRPSSGLSVAIITSLTSAANLTPDGTHQICPLKGQQFSIPTNLAQESIFQEAVASLSSTLTANLTQTPYNSTTFSIGIFSPTDPDLLWEYHHTDGAVTNSTQGANEADADSIYRIASISKVLTIYLWLIRSGERRLNDPIIELVPELGEVDRNGVNYALPDWSEITVNDLMMYLAGIGRDYGLNDASIEDSVTDYLSEAAAEGFRESPAPQGRRPFCGFVRDGVYNGCRQDNYLQGVSTLAAVFAPGFTPMYSNANWAILGYALSNLLNSSMETIFNTSLIEPLDLTGTSYTTPKSITKHSVIPNGNVSYSGWSHELGPLASAAGAYSTTADLAKIGKAILNHTLLSPTLTRRWWSTTTFVDESDQAVGRGWEIFRQKVGGHTVDLYTKSGNWGVYTSILALIPSYNIGFSLLTASTTSHGQVTESLPNTLFHVLLPALERITRSQAAQNFAGTYTSPSTNSTLTLTLDSLPGMSVTTYTHRGVDLLYTVFGRENYTVDFRLVPNALYSRPLEKMGLGKVGFTAIYALPEPLRPAGDFYWPCQNWLDVDDYTFGNVPLGQMVFQTDERGRACGVEMVALGVWAGRVQLPFLTDYCDELHAA